MAEIIEQGELNVLGTTLATGSTAVVSTKLLTMRFYNPLAYVLTVERYDPPPPPYRAVLVAPLLPEPPPPPPLTK